MKRLAKDVLQTQSQTPSLPKMPSYTEEQPSNPVYHNLRSSGLRKTYFRNPSTRTRILRLLLVTSLVTAAVLCAVLSYKALSHAEKEVARYTYESIASSALQGAREITKRKIQGSQAMATFISHVLPLASQWPLIDMDWYMPIAARVAAISSSTTQSLMVFLRPEQVADFEEHAYNLYRKEGRPMDAGMSEFGFGIWKNDPVLEERVHDVSGETSWGGKAGVLAPLMLHNIPNAKSLLYNVYSEKTRGVQLDSMLACAAEARTLSATSPSCATITDMLELKLRPGPAGLLFQPIFPASDPQTLVGFTTTSIHWEEVLTSVVPDYVNGLICVVSTDTASYTYEIREGGPEFVGPGDLHDPKYEQYARSVVLNDFMETDAGTSFVYTLTVYPTQAMFDTFTTTNPMAVAVGFSGVIGFCMCLFFVYDYLMRHEAHERKLVLDMKRRFMRFISHEIRTPLNTVCMGLDLLESEINPRNKDATLSDDSSHRLEDDDVQFWHNILVDVKENSNIAISILNDLLDYDKLETGLLKLEMGQVPIWDLVWRTAKQFNIQAANRRINLTVDTQKPTLQPTENVDPEAGGKRLLGVFGDDVKLCQVIRNLLSNALKFTPEDGTIEVKTFFVKDGLPNAKMSHRGDNPIRHGFPHQRAGSIKIAVVDSGVGLSHDQLGLLFSEGVQFDANKLQHGGGSGLGLNIAKGIVEQHAGTISAHSSGIGKGTTFTIELPIFEFNSEQTDEAMISKANGADTGTSKTTSFVTDLSDESEKGQYQRNILVVEDSETSRKMLIRLLERSGHTCIPASNGQAALDAVKRDLLARQNDQVHKPIDTILMDFEMPLLRGPEATRKIRKLGFVGTILGVTGNVLTEDVDFFINNGADEVLAKPVSMDCLRSCWERHPGADGRQSLETTIRRNQWSFASSNE